MLCGKTVDLLGASIILEMSSDFPVSHMKHANVYAHKRKKQSRTVSLLHKFVSEKTFSY